MKRSALSFLFLFLLSTFAFADPFVVRGFSGGALISANEEGFGCFDPNVCKGSLGQFLVTSPTGSLLLEATGSAFQTAPLNVGDSSVITIGKFSVARSGEPFGFFGDTSISISFGDGIGFVFKFSDTIFNDPFRLVYEFGSGIQSLSLTHFPSIALGIVNRTYTLGSPTGARFSFVPNTIRTSENTAFLTATVTRLDDIAPVPEPATLILLSSGLALIAARKKLHK